MKQFRMLLLVLARTVVLLWQLPQVVISIAALFLFRAKFRNKVVIFHIFRVSVFAYGNDKNKTNMTFSLGPIVIASRAYYGVDLSDITISHECGHSKQSIILGPLYLPVVALPSVTFNIISRFSRKFSKNYYKRFPENWADRLSNIVRV